MRRIIIACFLCLLVFPCIAVAIPPSPMGALQAQIESLLPYPFNATDCTANGRIVVWDNDGSQWKCVENWVTNIPLSTNYTIIGDGDNLGSSVALDSDLASTASTDSTTPSAKAVKQRLQHKSWSFDPKAVCDGAVDRLFLMSTGTSEAQGIIVTAWKLSFEADPTTEVDLDLKRADAFIGVANAAVMDVLDTTNGASSESTAANINGGAAVATGKVLYLEFGTAYTETTHQIIFEMWYYEVGA